MGTCCPRIKSITGRAFLGETRTNRNTARASAITIPFNRVSETIAQPLLESDCLLCPGVPMPLKESGRSKLSKLVPHHIFCHEHRNELLAVMDSEGMSDHIRYDGGPSRPGL